MTTTSPPPPVIYRFGVFELRARTGELRRRGITLRLRGHPIEILTLLLGRPGDLVSREELRRALWQGTFVDFEHGLNSAMNRLREALGETADNPRFIETLPRKGYRFIAPVEVVPDVPAGIAAAPSEAARERSPGTGTEDHVASPQVPAPPARGAFPTAMWPLLLLALVGVVWMAWPSRVPALPETGRVMLLVLPFESLGASADEEMLAEGMTDEIILQLGALAPGRFGVLARTTSMQYRQLSKSLRDVGHDLNVQYVVEGTVRRDGDVLRLTARLVDTSTQTQIWAESYQHDLDDVLMAQRDIARGIAQSLGGSGLSPLASPPRVGASSFQAYELVLRGRALRQQATEQAAWQCIDTFAEAIRIAPDFAPAHAGLADCYRLLGGPGWEAGPPAELLEQARRAADRALTLDPRLADAYAVRGLVVASFDWDLDAAERDIERAITINPSYARAHQYLSSVLTVQGRFHEAVAAAQRASDLDPLSAAEATTLGIRLYYAGRYEEAGAQLEAAAARHGTFPAVHWGLGVTYRELGRHADAIAELRRAVSLSQQSPYMRAWLAHALATAGARDEAVAVRGDLEQLSRDRFVSPFLFALIAAGLGEHDVTLRWLERTRDVRSGWMPFASVQPELRALRGDSRFEALLAQVVPRDATPTPRNTP